MKQLRFRGMRVKNDKLELRENDVERQVNDFLRAHQWMVHRLHVGTMRALDGSYLRMYPEGTPDWMATHTQRPAIYYELKAPGKKPTDAQLLQIMYLGRVGYFAGWWDSLETFVADYRAASLP